MACLLLGAGGALTAAGFALGCDGLRWGFPAALALAWVGDKFVSYVEGRRVRMFRGLTVPGAEADGGRDPGS